MIQITDLASMYPMSAPFRLNAFSSHSPPQSRELTRIEANQLATAKYGEAIGTQHVQLVEQGLCYWFPVESGYITSSTPPASFSSSLYDLF